MTKFLQSNILPNAAKVLFAISVMVISMAMFIASINKAMAAPAPIPHVTVTDENITLGDVFTDITKQADFVLAPAPEPGKVLTWDSRTLSRISKAFDLKWTASGGDQITIRRLANIVTSEMIKDAVRESLKKNGTSGSFDIEFMNGDTSKIILPHDIEPSVTVIDSSYNASRQTFSATLRTPDNNLTQITGVTYPLVSVPVLKLGARRGDTIGRNDIAMINIREDLITESMVLRADELVGMTPRKIIRAKTPVAQNDLEKPLMVKRGELVTMELNHGAIQVTALAKALENGTSGDIIRLMNIGSKRTVEAQITGPRTAKVTF